MAVSIEPIEGVPAIVVWHPDHHATEADVLALKAAAYALYQQTQGHIYLIHDLRKIQVGFNQLVPLLSALQREPHRLTSLPLTIYDIFDSTNALLNVALNSAQKVHYGRMDVKVVSDLDEAISAIQQHFKTAGGTVAS
jgi:hypothetical protein